MQKLSEERGEFDKILWDTVEATFTKRKAQANE